MNDLSDISKRLNAQDNRCTLHPMFCLQIKVRDVGYAPQHSDGNTVWINMNSGDYEEVAPDTEGAEEFGYKDRWETVMVAFTEQGILDYMREDGHNVKRRAHNGETRIYVESFYRCDEMIRIRNFLKELATAPVHQADHRVIDSDDGLWCEECKAFVKHHKNAAARGGL